MGSGIRPQYAQLSLLRQRLGGNVLWFACSATLDQKTLDIARKMTGFQASCEFCRSSIDRQPRQKSDGRRLKTQQEAQSPPLAEQHSKVNDTPVPGILLRVVDVGRAIAFTSTVDPARTWQTAKIIDLSSNHTHHQKKKEDVIQTS